MTRNHAHSKTHAPENNDSGKNNRSNQALASKIAAAALALGMALPAGAALAQDSVPAAAPITTATTTENTVAVTQQTPPQLSSSYSFGYDPLLPLALILALGGAYGAVTLVAGTKRMRSTFLRAAAGGVLATALMGPYILEEKRAPLDTEVVVIIDRSASQNVADRAAVTTAAQDQLIARLQDMGGVNVRMIETGGPRNGLVNDGTELLTAISENTADIMPERLGAVILITDGQVHDAAAARLPAGVPLHVLLTGDENERDRRIVLESAPVYGVVGAEQTIRFHVAEDGSQNTAPVRVDVAADGEIIATHYVTPSVSTEVKLTLPRTGSNLITVNAETVAGELSPANNSFAIDINGVRDEMRVLLVSGSPTNSVRSLRTLLKNDLAAELVHFTIMRPTDIKQDPTPITELALVSYPTRELFEERINDFDLIILDQYEAEGTLPAAYYENMAQYVEKGGAMLVLSGPDYAGARSLINTPLARILPATPLGTVTQEPFTPQVNETGLRHPVTRALPDVNNADGPQWGRWFQMVDARVNDSAAVVMTGPQDKPLLVLDRQGEGRIGMVLSDQAWLWARGFEQGGPYGPLLSGVSHWLLGAPGLEEEALRVKFNGGQATLTRQTLEDHVGPVTLTAPSGTAQTVQMTMTAPGQWTATVDAGEIGIYRATQDDHNAIAHAGPVAPREYADLRATPDILAPIAQGSGGNVFRIGGAPANLNLPQVQGVARSADAQDTLSGANWLGLRLSAASDLQGSARHPLLAGWVAFTLIVGLMAAAWLREGDPKTVRRMFGFGRRNGTTPQP